MSRPPAGREMLKVLFVGNLSERKGASDLLHALQEPVLQEVPVELVMAGGGDIARYRDLAVSLGSSRRSRPLSAEAV